MRHTDGVEYSLERLANATADLTGPFAVIDQVALESNAASLLGRAAPKPVRIATKSVRVRQIIERQLKHGFHGVMTYSLAESLWLSELGVKDILLAYPSVDRLAIKELSTNQEAARNITLMVDSVAGLDLIESALSNAPAQIRVAIDVDSSLRIGGIHLGTRRSPLHTPQEVEDFAKEIVRRKSFDLVGLMFYDAQIAGLADSSPAVRLVKRMSNKELLKRRAQIVSAVGKHCSISIVNGGGTGSLSTTSKDDAINELTAGSGLFHSHHFDNYDEFTGQPAAYFVTQVVRKPTTDIATVFSGGYIASGAAGKSRLPIPVWPAGLSLLGTEGAGEVQTPLKGATQLSVGDQVWFRHTKAGEMCERFDEVHIVDANGNRTTVPTYRGEGKNFG